MKFSLNGRKQILSIISPPLSIYVKMFSTRFAALLCLSDMDFSYTCKKKTTWLLILVVLGIGACGVSFLD